MGVDAGWVDYSELQCAEPADVYFGVRCIRGTIGAVDVVWHDPLGRVRETLVWDRWQERRLANMRLQPTAIRRPITTTMAGT